jgi:hypothetical protein
MGVSTNTCTLLNPFTAHICHYFPIFGLHGDRHASLRRQQAQRIPEHRSRSTKAIGKFDPSSLQTGVFCHQSEVYLAVDRIGGSDEPFLNNLPQQKHPLSFLLHIMKTTAVALLLALLASLITDASGEGGLRSGTNAADLMRKLDDSNGTLTFSEAGVFSEDEAFDVCNTILALFQMPIKASIRLPFDYGCSCHVNVWQRKLDFSCGVKICSADIMKLLGLNSLPLPIKNDFCFSPSYTGWLTRGPTLRSVVTTGMSDLVIEKTALAQMTMGLVNLKEDLVFDIPDIKISVNHRKGNVLALESCSVQIDPGMLLRNQTQSCGCEICSAMGTDIKLDCTDFLDSFIPQPLQGWFEITNQCVGLQTLGNLIFSGNEDAALAQDPPTPLISPFLSMVRKVKR